VQSKLELLKNWVIPFDRTVSIGFLTEPPITYQGIFPKLGCGSPHPFFVSISFLCSFLFFAHCFHFHPRKIHKLNSCQVDSH